MTDLTTAERAYLARSVKILDDLKQFLCAETCNFETISPLAFYSYIAKAKLILGNLNLSVSFAGNLMAKHYLMGIFTMTPFDAAQKPQGAPGLDIDATTIDGKRVVAEIKTTDSYLTNDLGAQQKAEFRKDFEKLRSAQAEHKFFFVTEARTFEAMKKKYAREIPGVTVVLLTTAEEYLA
jgi:hypothetical protein